MIKKHWAFAICSGCLVGITAVLFAGFVLAADEPRVAAIVYGDVSVELGMNKHDVLAALEPGFQLVMQSPDIHFPEFVSYSIHDRAYLPETEALRSLTGSVTFSDGKLCAGSRRVMGGNRSLDSRELMKFLTDLLSETSERLDRAPAAGWDDGVFRNRKTGNRRLVYDFGLEKVQVQYFDSPGGSQDVTLTVLIGKV